jgi:hypothetical protein
MLGVAASMAVAGPATAGQRPTTAPPAKAVKPPANQLYGVSCPSANDCVAVGVNANAADTGKRGRALIQTWNGTTWTSVAHGRTWTRLRPPEPKGRVTGELEKVSCPSATDCIAVGTSGSDTAEFALADAWNGKTWTRMSVQPPAGAKDDAALIGVSCTAAKNCVAVGVGVDGAHGGLLSFAEVWDGKTWAAGKISWPKGISHPYLVAVSCRSANSCVAVGFIDADFNDGGHTGRAAATSWNGKTWTATSVPAPGKDKGKASLFSEVSCPAAGGCVAVGQLGPYNSDEGSGLAGFWNGRSLKLETTP